MKTTLRTVTNQALSTDIVEYNFDILAQELWEVSQLRKKIEEQEKELKKRLESYLDGMEAQAWMGHSFIFSSSVRKGAIDYSAIPELQQIDLEQYRKEPVTCWKLSKIEGK